MGGKSKTPEATPQQRAFEDAQARALSKEITEENRRRKALIRGQLGAGSLLTGLDAGIDAGGDTTTTAPAAAPGASNTPRRQGANGRRANAAR